MEGQKTYDHPNTTLGNDWSLHKKDRILRLAV